MDGTKRKAGGVPLQPSDTIDLGSTPPWALPLVYHEESALRSTQSPETKLTINPVALYGSIATIPRTVPTWSGPYPLPLEPTDVKPRKRIGKRTPLFTASIPHAEDNDDDVVIGVDTDDGHDSVYHTNAREDSWSAALRSEDDPKVQATLPDQAILALQHLKRAQQLADQYNLLDRRGSKQHDQADDAEAEADEDECSACRPNVEEYEQSLAADDDDDDKNKWQNDLLLRNIMRRIKHKLIAGAVLTVERLGPVNFTIMCAHPHCPAPECRIPPGAYYIILGQPRQLESAERSCLFCLEWLWNGKGMCEPLPDASVTATKNMPRVTVSMFNLDGAMDDDVSVEAAVNPSSPTTSMLSLQSSAASAASTPATQHSTVFSPNPQSKVNPEEGERPGTPSPVLRKAMIIPTMSREARDLFEGFGEAFLNGQVRVARKRGDETDTDRHDGTRRSARLQPTKKETAEGVMSGKARIEQRQAVEASSNKVNKVASVETIADEVAKGEQRLEEMYKQREAARTSLQPGESSVIRLPKCPKDSAKHMIRVDEFGVPFTDFLAEPATKHWCQQNVCVDKPATLELGSTIAGPVPDQLRDSASVQSWIKRQKDRQCVCYGDNDVEKSVEHKDERCLVGRYHLDCIGALPDSEDQVALEGVTDLPDGWLCSICKRVYQSCASSMRPWSVTAEVIECLFAIPRFQGTQANNGGIYQLGSTSGERDITYAGEEQASDVILPQLDGPSDHSPVSGLRPKQPAIDPNWEIPLSLLSSKHAPLPESLSCYPLAIQYPQPRTPPVPELEKTPGGPDTPNSTTSTGEWRRPPTRFQHLAAFVRAGNSLDEVEKGAVGSWKATSIEQTKWNRHLKGAEDLRESFVGVNDQDGGSGSDSGGVVVENENSAGLEEGEIAEGIGAQAKHSVKTQATAAHVKAEEDADGTASKLKAGIEQKDCRGKDLTAVLAAMHAGWGG